MGIIKPAMRRVVDDQKLGFVATVNDDGSPNLSPKGTLAVWDPDHLIFADLASPRTVANLGRRADVEVNVVDPFARKGYRFRGVACLPHPGPGSRAFLEFFERRGVLAADRRIRPIVLIQVREARPLVSPTYDRSISEEEVRRRWKEYYDRIDRGESDLPDPA